MQNRMQQTKYISKFSVFIIIIVIIKINIRNNYYRQIVRDWQWLNYVSFSFFLLSVKNPRFFGSSERG